MSRAVLPRRLLPRRRRVRTERTRRFRARWALIPLGIIVVIAALALVDNAMHSDEVLRNVSLAGVSVGGQSEADLRATLDEMQPTLHDLPVELAGPDETVTITKP